MSALTEKQLYTLATEVMGWVKEKRRYWTAQFRCWWWVDADGEMVCPVEGWHPDTDLNQFFPLLDAFNEKAQEQESDAIYLHHEHYDYWELRDVAEKILTGDILTKEIAAKGCEAILERLGGESER